MPVKHLSSVDEWKALINGEKVVIVDFTAAWCGPCRVIGPIFEQLSEKYASDSVVFLKVDVDEHEKVAGDCGISAMPTFQVWKSNTKLKEIIGSDKKKLEALIQDAIAQPVAA